MVLAKLVFSFVSVHGLFTGLTTPTQLAGSFVVFLVTGFFVFGDDDAFLLRPMSPGAVPVALCG
jgi:hypothetical protein